MTRWRYPIASALAGTLALAMGAQTALAQKPPFAGDPDAKEVEPKPKVRTWTVNSAGFSYNLEFNPGIPDAGQMVEINIAVAQIPKTPHPRYGNRIPQGDARFVVELTDPSGKVVGRYRAHEIPLSQGRYGLHFTPTEEGLFGLKVVGRSKDDKPMQAETKLPVNVWPLPEDLKGKGDDAGNIRRRRPIIVPK